MLRTAVSIAAAHDRILAGVAGASPSSSTSTRTLVRVLWFLSIFVGGLGILLYIGMAIIVPLEPARPRTADDTAVVAAAGRASTPGPRGGDRRPTMFLGSS